MAFIDKRLTCVVCGEQFIFTAGEQEFFAQKGFLNEPKRCKRCKSSQKKAGFEAPRGPGEAHEVICAQCGQKATVPFKPVLDKPVYCKSCYQARRGLAGREAPYR